MVCGEGYSCYFSGYNYHCCPTNDKDFEQQHENKNENSNEQIESEKCPDGTFMVLNLEGNPIQCNPNLNQCPEVNKSFLNLYKIKFFV